MASNQQPLYEPSPAEIAERAAAIRAEWPEHKQGPPRERAPRGVRVKLWCEEPRDAGMATGE